MLFNDFCLIRLNKITYQIIAIYAIDDFTYHKDSDDHQNDWDPKNTSVIQKIHNADNYNNVDIHISENVLVP